jgi:hypothetical protein
MPDPATTSKPALLSGSSAHKRDALEARANLAFKAGAFIEAAAFAQAAGLYAIANAIYVCTPDA